jgi:SAM-dependent methyltransferase
MDGADPGRWSQVAADWARWWGGLATPACDALLHFSEVSAGARVLDVGCGAGDLLARVDRLGMLGAGIDPAPAMVALARSRLPNADIRVGDAMHLPWPDGHFDLVTSVNALHFAQDTLEALAEAVRVTVPGGQVGLANWAESRRNDLAVVEAAVARAQGEEPLPDGDLRLPDGLESLLEEGGLSYVANGVVRVVFEVGSEEALVQAILMGEEPANIAALAQTVIDAAAPFRVAGGYRLVNAFRFALARKPAA